MPEYRFDEIAFNSKEKKKPTEEDKYTYIGLEHLDTGSLTVSRWGSEIAPTGDKLVMHKGDVLFGKRRAYQKKVAIAPFDGIFSAHGMVLRPKEEVITKDFFPLFVSSDYFLDEAIKISVGSLSPTINWSDLKELSFTIPSLEEQKKLAPVIWAAIDTKNAYKKLLLGIDELVKSQFIEMIANTECMPLSEICSSYGRGKTPKYVDSSRVHVLNQACIYWDGLRTENIKFYDETKFSNDNALQYGDVLLNSTGTGTLGRAHVFDIEDDYTYTADSHVSILRPLSDKMLPVVLQYYFYDDYYQSELYRTCVFGSTSQAELSKEALARMPVPIIGMEKQEAFVAFVEQSDKSKFVVKKNLKTISLIYQR